MRFPVEVYALAALAGVLLAPVPAGSLVFFATGDPSHNTSPPAGALTGSGWQWVGSFGRFQGTPVGPRHFLAARHIGLPVGTPLVLNGVSYPTTAFFDDAGSDLRLWQIDGTFASWAPLYRGSGEVGQPFVVFGRGAGRGGEIRNAAGELRGWAWGGGAGTLRWGRNVVASVVNGGAYWGELLYATFDQKGGADEAHLTGGDSSSPMLIQDGGAWKLAGVAAAVDAYFNTANAGPGFAAALFDARGLYFGPTPDGPWGSSPISGVVAVPSGFYLTRVSARAAWIDSILARLPQTIDFSPIADRVLSASPFTAVVSASSGLPVTLSVASGPATVAGNTVTLTGLGTVTLRATQAGDGTYLPATPVDRTFRVTAAGTVLQVPALPHWAIVLLAGVLACAVRKRCAPPRSPRRTSRAA